MRDIILAIFAAAGDTVDPARSTNSTTAVLAAANLTAMLAMVCAFSSASATNGSSSLDARMGWTAATNSSAAVARLDAASTAAWPWAITPPSLCAAVACACTCDPRPCNVARNDGDSFDRARRSASPMRWRCAYRVSSTNTASASWGSSALSAAVTACAAAWTCCTRSRPDSM